MRPHAQPPNRSPAPHPLNPIDPLDPLNPLTASRLIYSIRSTLSVSGSSRFTSCTANDGGYGGGMYVGGSSTALVSGAAFDACSSERGGAVCLASSTASFIDLKVANNKNEDIYAGGDANEFYNCSNSCRAGQYGDCEMATTSDYGTCPVNCGSCNECPDGASTNGRPGGAAPHACVPCSAGSAPDINNTACEICPAGSAAGTGAAECEPCLGGRYSAADGSRSCDGQCDATAGFWSAVGGTACDRAAAGYFWKDTPAYELDDMEEPEPGGPVKCPEGGECNYESGTTVDTIAILPGYYRAEGSAQVYRCGTGNCLGGSAPFVRLLEPKTESGVGSNQTGQLNGTRDVYTAYEDVVCREGSGGMLCAVCDDNYYMARDVGGPVESDTEVIGVDDGDDGDDDGSGTTDDDATGGATGSIATVVDDREGLLICAECDTGNLMSAWLVRHHSHLTHHPSPRDRATSLIHHPLHSDSVGRARWVDCHSGVRYEPWLPW